MRQVEFEQLVAEALDALPAEIQSYMENIVVTLADWPSRAELESVGRGSPYELLGLYQGVPLTQRGRAYNMTLPDRIVIYRGPIEALVRHPDSIRYHIQRTVAHEIGHHFGITDEELRALGY